jgi:hypothetical protein
MRRLITTILAFLLAIAVWVPCLHLFFKPDIDSYFAASGVPPRARELAASQLALWAAPALRSNEVSKMRASNAEWDFMGRTFLVMSLANMALREPTARSQYLEIMDCIIDETLRLEHEKGIYYFLLDYAKKSRFVSRDKRSVFQDGEIALMLAARRMVEEKPAYAPLLTNRVALMMSAMEESPVLCAESYPNECWIFCNTVALAAMVMSDILDSTDHSNFVRRWLATAKSRLTHPQTGLLISSFNLQGYPLDGPEGSSIWMAAHCLRIVDKAYAAGLYDRARTELGRTVLGFGYAKEWPASWRNVADIDSGPVIPVLEISAGSSGLAFLGAGTFADKEYLSALLTSLNYGGFPIRSKGRLRYSAGNQVGDAVLLYSMVQGPLWAEVERRKSR